MVRLAANDLQILVDIFVAFISATYDGTYFVENEELQNPTEQSDTSAESSDANEEESSKGKNMPNNIQQMINQASDSQIPDIIKRPQPIVSSHEIVPVNIENGGQQPLFTIGEESNEDLNSQPDASNVSSIHGIYQTEEQSGHNQSNEAIGDPLDAVMESLLRTPNKQAVDPNMQPVDDYFGNDLLNESVSLEQKISYITKVLSVVATKQLIIESKIDNIITMLIKPYSENLADLFPEKLPVDSVEDFVKLNEKLSDNSFRAKLVSCW